MSARAASFNLILGDQLFADTGRLPDGPILMVEDRGIATRHRYHSHKLVLTFSAMRHYAASLGSRVVYRNLEQRTTLEEALWAQRREGFREVHTFEPADEPFGDFLRGLCSECGLQLTLWRNPMYLTSKDEWDAYASPSERRLMADFYRSQRRRLGILVDGEGNPVGGRWSFDEDNRKSLPRGHRAPIVEMPTPDATTRQVIATVRQTFPDHVGDPEEFSLPVCHADAVVFLDRFLEERLDRFGDYEDAISSEQRTLYHSLLSPLLNIGLLTPEQVVEAALRRHASRPVPLNSLEGFLRQVVGWREFVRGIHRERRWVGASAGSRLPGPEWYRGATGLPPLDASIRRAVRYGWCHHIERLMVIGSALFMCDVRADAVYRYFMEMFVDAAEWVMEPNVYGMSQFVQPTFATKPYMSRSAYILRMSDYEKGEWCDVWDGLYWRTVHRLKDRLAANPRMSQAARSLERLDPARRDRIFSAAESFVARTTSAAPVAR